MNRRAFLVLAGQSLLASVVPIVATAAQSPKVPEPEHGELIRDIAAWADEFFPDLDPRSRIHLIVETHKIAVRHLAAMA